MLNPDADRRLGKRLVSTGQLSSEDLLTALEAQRQQGVTQRKGLGEILVELGHLSVDGLQATMVVKDNQILWCPRCQVEVTVQGTVHDARTGCPKCQGDLLPTSPPPSPVVGETCPAMPVPGGSAEDLSEEIRQALADPSRCIGRYAVLGELGRGGMGVVYRGYDPQLHRDVAIKMIHAERADAEGLARFMREAQACAKLHHPSIVAVHEVGEHDSHPYLVMDLVEGQTLADVIDGESLSLQDLVGIARDIALALDHAHSAGIIHRDVKPSNIILSDKGRALLMDFGLARDTSAQQQLTKTGQLLGTPLYMAPEQIQGSGLGPWTDVYALGAVLYRGLAGAPPFVHESQISLFRAILLDEPQSLRARNVDVSPDLETIALKCLEKPRARRYSSAAALAEDLQRFLHGHAILARPITRTERAIRWIRRNRALSASLAATMVLMVGGLVAGLYLAREAESEAVRREERAKVLTKQEATRQEKENTRREKEQERKENLQALRWEVTEVLDRVQSGRILEDASDAELAKARLLKHRDAETVRLLTSRLDELSKHLAEDQDLSQAQELFLHFLCEALWNLGISDTAVSSLGRYLQGELALPTEKRNQLRAVPAGKALCFLSGKEADGLLLEARDGFGLNDAFWGQVQPFYKRTGVDPVLEAETSLGFLNRGLTREAKGDLDGAIADYTQALKIDPYYFPALMNRGILRKEQGDPDGAINDYKRAIEIKPTSAKAWATCGAARFAKGDLDGAIEDCSRAIEFEPNLALAWDVRGQARQTKRDLVGAIADYTRAIKIDPNDEGPWLNRGYARLAKGNLDGAINDCTRALEINPDSAAALTNRGGARGQQGDPDGAIDDYTHAIKIDPYLTMAWCNRANARLAKGDLEGAIEDCSRAIEIDSNVAMAWMVRGSARGQNGDLEGAISDVTRYIKMQPNDGVAWNFRAWARFESGELDSAFNDVSKALQLEPNDPYYLDTRGQIWLGKGEIEKALTDLDLAAQLAPRIPEIRLNRSRARVADGDVTGAIEDIEHFLEHAPEHPLADTARIKLLEVRRQQAEAGK